MKEKSKNQIAVLRKKIDEIDKDILILLGERFRTTSKIQYVKRALHLAIAQNKRERGLLSRYRLFAKKYNLPPLFIKKLFQTIFSYAKKTDIIKGTK